MRLNVHHLTLKILANRPRVVCFVGKKIWDVYESVVSKTAGPAIAISKVEGREVKVEVGVEQPLPREIEVKEEPEDDKRLVKVGEKDEESNDDLKPDIPPRLESAAAAKKPTINWTHPRGFRLQNEMGFTYFWVTPNTSGLERTPVGTQRDKLMLRIVGRTDCHLLPSQAICRQSGRWLSSRPLQRHKSGRRGGDRARDSSACDLQGEDDVTE